MRLGMDLGSWRLLFYLWFKRKKCLIEEKSSVVQLGGHREFVQKEWCVDLESVTYHLYFCCLDNQLDLGGSFRLPIGFVNKKPLLMRGMSKKLKIRLARNTPEESMVHTLLSWLGQKWKSPENLEFWVD